MALSQSVRTIAHAYGSKWRPRVIIAGLSVVAKISPSTMYLGAVLVTACVRAKVGGSQRSLSLLFLFNTHCLSAGRLQASAIECACALLARSHSPRSLAILPNCFENCAQWRWQTQTQRN